MKPDRRNEFLESLIKEENLTPERQQDYENKINGNKNSITKGDEKKK